MLKLLRQFLSTLIGLLLMTVDKPESKAEETQPQHAKSKTRPRVTFYSAYETTPLSATEINAALQQKGYKPIPETEIQGGGGGSLVTNGRLVIEGGAHGFGVSDKDSKLGMGMGGVHLHLGYIIKQNRLLRIYPLFGPGALGGSVQRTDDQSEVLGVFSGKFDVGLGIDVRLKIWRFGMLGGIQFGYSFGLGTQATGLGNREISKPFFRVVYGSGKWA